MAYMLLLWSILLMKLLDSGVGFVNSCILDYCYWLLLFNGHFVTILTNLHKFNDTWPICSNYVSLCGYVILSYNVIRVCLTTIKKKTRKR